MGHTLEHKLKQSVERLRDRARDSLFIISAAIVGVGASAGLVPATAGATSWHSPPGSTVYDNIPNKIPGNVPSVGFEATSTSEVGSQIGLAGSQRKNPKVKVLMSSWACKSGTWQAKNCITNPGSTFTHPVTLNVYKVNSDDSVGPLIKTVTKTFTMPYRPTADDGTNCKDTSGNPTGEWWDGTKCNNGKAFTINFKLDNVTLPDDVILGVAYNTTNHGYAPIGTTACNSTTQGCPYDSLNLGTNPTPTVGTSEPSNNDAYYNSSVAGFYCDGGTAGTGTFRLDSGCWTGFLPAFEVEASGGHTGHQGGHHHGHRHRSSDNDDRYRHNKYSGTHGFYSLWRS